MKRRSTELLLLWAIPALLAGSTLSPGPPRVGSPAPTLALSEWFRGAPITAFAPGHVYVIDVWAPWCGPCLGGMKRLTALQQKNASRGLVIVGVTGPDDYGTTPDSARKVVADKKSDIGYSVGWSPDFYKTWMALESSAGWPWCFVIDRQGRVAFIGHPERLEDSLEQILAGSYDLQAATVRYGRRAKALETAAVFDKAYDARDWQKAEPLFAVMLDADEEVGGAYAAHEYKILAYRLKDARRAADFGRSALATFLNKDWGMLSRLAEMILDPKLDLDPRDIELARLLAQRADELAGQKNAHVAATFARACFAAGKRQEAVDAQRRALRLADPDDRSAFQAVLDSYLGANVKADPSPRD